MQSKKQEFPFKDLFVPFTTLKAIHWIIFIGLVVFANMLFNGFVWDDKTYIINNLEVHKINLGLIFGHNLFNNAGQYRPLQPLYFSFVYTLFGTNVFPYHLLQIFIHIASTSLLYILFRKFLSNGVAIFAAFVFLIHPIQVESVSFIAQTASPFFFLLGITALLIAIKQNLSVKWLITIYSLLFLSMLEKETGIIFLLLVLLYSFLFMPKKRMKLVAVATTILLVYILIRFGLVQIFLSKRALGPIVSLSLPERILNMPLIIFYYLKTFFLPKLLTIDQQWVIPSVTFSNFYLPLLMDALFFSVICLSGFFIYKHRKLNFKPYLFFLIWFLAGILFHLQIFPLDATVADRWFYQTLAGLLGLLSIIYQSIFQKVKVSKVILVLLAGVVLVGLSLRTIDRNTNWVNNLTLFNHDILTSDNFDLQNTLGLEYLNTTREYSKALPHFQQSVQLRPFELNYQNLALTYLYLGNIQSSEIYFKKAMQKDQYKLFQPHLHNINTYLYYALMLSLYESPASAIHVIKNGLSDYPSSADLWMYLAVVKYKQHNQKAAFEAASKAYQLDPSEEISYVYQHIQNNEAIRINFNGKTYSF